MDEKTESLRDIFMDVAEEETVTESQSEGRGSLRSDADVAARLVETVAEMRSVCEFRTDLEDETYADLVERFYAGESDAEIAQTLQRPAETIARARLDLHLLREDDREPPVPFPELRERLEDAGPAAVAESLDVDAETVAWYGEVAEARAAIQRVSDRFRGEFEALLRDDELSERLTDSVGETGLEGATEGQETDVSL